MTKKYKIYLLYTGSYCKIGVTSRRISDRVKEIQTSCPLPIHQYTEIGTLSKATAFYVENIIKEHLSHHRTFGEWYKEIPSLRKTVVHLIHKHSSEEFSITRYNTEYDKFEDVSIQLFNKIQKGRKEHDISYLSQLYTNFNKEKNLKDDSRFLAYPRDSLISILENAIGITIAYCKNNKLSIDDSITNRLTKDHQEHNPKQHKKKFVPKRNWEKKFRENNSFLFKDEGK